MADLGLVALILVFFVLARAYVAGCASLLGDVGDGRGAGEQSAAALTASGERGGRPHGHHHAHLQNVLIAPPTRRTCPRCQAPGQHLLRRCKTCGRRYMPKDRFPAPPDDLNFWR